MNEEKTPAVGPPFPRVLAVASQKGGSGKTVTSVNLAAALGELDRRVLVVDLDPQASASNWLGVRDGGRGLADLFTGNGNLVDLVHNVDVFNVSVIPSSEWLVGAEKALSREDVGAETVLRGHMERLPRRWHYVIMDCPPSLGALTVNALTAAEEVLVPVAAQWMALSGLFRLLQTVDMVKARLNPRLRVSGILACMVDARTRHSQDVVEELRGKYRDLVFRTVIHQNVRLTEAPSFHKPATVYAPHSTGAEDFRQLAAEVIAQERRKRT